jgi:hypothetical protein
MRKTKRGIFLLFNQPRRFLGRIFGPRVYVTSVPKSGTNMLMNILSLFPQLTLNGTLVGLTKEEQVNRIGKLRRGCVISSHLSLSPQLEKILVRRNVKVIFIIRDPRDVCVSLHHWIKRFRDHYFHSSYMNYANDYERLMICIKGQEALLSNGIKNGLVSIENHFLRRSAWLDYPGCCSVRYEHLVGPSGGGDTKQQREEINRIERFLDLTLSLRDMDYVVKNIYSTKSATFRKGQIGGWREEMTEAHKSAFKEVSGQLLIDLGYEKDLLW